MKVDEVGLLLRHLYGYPSVFFLKPVIPLKLPGRLNLARISCCLEKNAILHKPKDEVVIRLKRLHSKNRREDLLLTVNNSPKK